MLAALLLPSLLAPGTPPPVDAIKLIEPRVEYRNDEASATRSPWIDANGWRILRSPQSRFTYQVRGEAAALAAAEAFTYDAQASISADAAGAAAFAKMLEFLKTIPSASLSPAADFGVIDDGSNANGELLNLLTRMNLLYKLVKCPDPKFHVNVQLGTKEFPLADAKNPSIAAHTIRAQIGDDNRSFRVYGSEVVIGRLLAGSGHGRVFLLNYSTRPVLGLRVRIKGAYAKGILKEPSAPDIQPSDWTRDGPATEFSIPELHTFAVIDLTRN